MAPVDPGTAIAWAKRPLYTDSLLSQLAQLPRSDAQLLLTIQLSELGQTLSKRRMMLLRELTPKLFIARGEGTVKAKSEKSHEGSVSRRLQQLSTEFRNSLNSLRTLQGQAKADKEASIRLAFPSFDRLHSLGHDDSQYLPHDERLLATDHWRPFRDRLAFVEAADAAEQAEAEEDAMEGIEYNARLPPQPVAGPAYPQQQPVALPPNPPPAPPPQPQPPHAQAPYHHPPSPFPAPQLNSPPRLVVHQAAARSPSAPLGDLTHCPTCDYALTTLSASAATDHLRQCLDGAGGTVMQCPVCELDLGSLGGKARETHVDACCKGGVGTDKGKERAREYAEFKADSKTLPRDPTTRDVAECGVCFDDFELETLLVRLSCYCVYHKHCMETWWRTPGAFCPMHRDDRVSGTDPDVLMI